MTTPGNGALVLTTCGDWPSSYVEDADGRLIPVYMAAGAESRIARLALAAIKAANDQWREYYRTHPDCNAPVRLVPVKESHD